MYCMYSQSYISMNVTIPTILQPYEKHLPNLGSFRGGFRGGAGDVCPLYYYYFFFSEIRSLTLCGPQRQKECTNSCKLTVKITFFSSSKGAHLPQTPLSPQVPKFCQSLIWAPLFKKILYLPLSFQFLKTIHSVSENWSTCIRFLKTCDVTCIIMYIVSF